jgi:S-adenosylmethionine:tRNA ribosyltransferase-isomerase
MQVKASKAVRPGTTISTAGGDLQVLARDADLWHIEFPRPVYEFLERFGAVPLPPYVTRAPDELDRERYQSLLARYPGAVAAPTASLHFDANLLARLAGLGVQHTCVTLHVGAGTFQPVRVADPLQHAMHPERFEIPASACEALNAARARGARIVAVGTTVVRTLETAVPLAGERWVPRSGETRIFIHPGVRFHAVDALLTNFHLPESTLLMLVSAFAGREAVLAAYRHAVEQRYRFFSYGDAMFITPAAGAREVHS